MSCRSPRQASGSCSGAMRASPGCAASTTASTRSAGRAARLLADGVPRLGEMGPERLARWLGAPRFRDEEITGRTRRAGVALGLAATRAGGKVLVVEAARLPGSGQLRVTGTVGPTTMESANVALTWVRSNAARLAGVAAGFNEGADVHVHLAEASRGKDGPSAGVTLAVAVVSALSGQPVRGDVAMTGELTLAGRVEPGRGHPGEGAGGVPVRNDGGAPARGERARCRRQLRRRAAGRHHRPLRDDDGRCARSRAARCRVDAARNGCGVDAPRRG